MNRIQLLLTDTAKEEAEILTHPILDDFMIEAATEFTSYADLAPTISSLTDLVNTFTVGSNNTVSQGGFNLRQVLDMQRWQRTNPVRITMQLLFYTKDNAKENVVDPINQLWGLHLPKIVNNQIKVPGMSASNAHLIEEAFKSNKASEKDKELLIETHGKDYAKEIKDKQYNSLFSVIIPGVVFIPFAFLYNMRPTYSKHTTINGYPLWATAEVEIQGISAAFHNNFTLGSKYYYNRSEGQILEEGANERQSVRGF